jgi:hypothetical protein
MPPQNDAPATTPAAATGAATAYGCRHVAMCSSAVRVDIVGSRRSEIYDNGRGQAF